MHPTKRPMRYSIFLQQDDGKKPFPMSIEAATPKVAAWVAMALTRCRALCQREDGATVTVALVETNTPRDVIDRTAAMALDLPRGIEDPLGTYAQRNALALHLALRTLRPGMLAAPATLREQYAVHPAWKRTQIVAGALRFTLKDFNPTATTPNQ
jgi:hypothetical protein